MKTSIRLIAWGLLILLFGLSGYPSRLLGEVLELVSAPSVKDAKTPPVQTRPKMFLEPSQRKTNKEQPNQKPADKQAKPAAPSNDPPKSPLMRGLYDEIEKFNDKDLDNQKAELRQQLREADALYGRIKDQNKDGIWRANHPPKMAPKKPAKKPEDAQPAQPTEPASAKVAPKNEAET